MTRNNPKTVQKPVTVRPRGSKPKRGMHLQTAKTMLNWLCYKIVNYLFVPGQKNQSSSGALSWQCNQRVNIFSQNKCTFPLNSFHKTAHGPNIYGESAW